MEQWNEIDCHGCGRQFCLFICYLIINKYKERVSFDLDNLEREDGDPDSDEENYNGEDSRDFFFSPFWKQPVYSWRRPRDGIKTGLSGS